MDQQRARLRVLDEENKYLGEMLEPPAPENPGALKPIPFDIFLRLPRDISQNIADKDGAYFIQPQTIYRFPGPEGYNVYLTAAKAGKPGMKTDLGSLEMTPEEFRDGFERALRQILKKNNINFRQVEKIESVVRLPTTYSGNKLPGLEFEYLVLEGDPNLKEAPYIAVYVHHNQRANRLVGLAFQVPQGHKADTAVVQRIELSLKSLDIGDNALPKRTAFGTTRRLD